MLLCFGGDFFFISVNMILLQSEKPVESKEYQIIADCVAAGEVFPGKINDLQVV